MELDFEWDEAKAKANFNAHGVSFELAKKVFKDVFAIEGLDDRKDYGEERINLVSMCGEIMLHVTYTEREDRIRIISARRAEKYEREDYHRENSF